MTTHRMTFRRSLPMAAFALMILGNVLASPFAAYADGDKGKGKDGKIPIIIQKPIIKPDPEPTPPPPPKK